MNIFLVTVNPQFDGTKTIFNYTGIFICNSNNYDILNETEIDIAELIFDNDSNYIRCGNVTGYNEQFFSDKDKELLAQYGFNNHFEF